MTPTQISTDIERGLELRKSIKTGQTELKEIEKRLEQAGLSGEQIPLQEADREGRQFLARSPKLGLIVPVVFESDQVVKSFRPDTPMHTDLERISHGQLSRFFIETRKFDRVQEEGQAFRKAAREILSAAAPLFISASLQRDKAGIPKSRTIIAWDNAKPIDQVTA
ncbi:MAG: hypothetical protein WCS52_19320 [bacterium]